MTVTDEDRKAAEDWLDETGGCGCDICLKQSAEFLSTIRQAAYAAGLERAAVIAEKMRDRCDPEMSHPEAIRYDEANAIATAIRAEKDKT